MCTYSIIHNNGESHKSDSNNDYNTNGSKIWTEPNALLLLLPCNVFRNFKYLMRNGSCRCRYTIGLAVAAELFLHPDVILSFIIKRLTMNSPDWCVLVATAAPCNSIDFFLLSERAETNYNIFICLLQFIRI